MHDIKSIHFYFLKALEKSTRAHSLNGHALCVVLVVFSVVLQEAPDQTVPDLQPHAGGDQSHLPRGTLPGRHLPHRSARNTIPGGKEGNEGVCV